MRPAQLLLALVFALVCGDAFAAPDPGGTDWTAGWSEGQPAAAAALALTPLDAIPVLIPDAVAERVTGPTALFYFSPTCPHCQAVMPEVRTAVARGDLNWIGVASGSSTAEDIAAFKKDYGADFDILTDRDHAFAQSMGARSTPSVYLVRLATTDAEPGNAAFVETGTTVELFEAYAPFGRGIGAILAMRTHLDDPFFAFKEGYQGDRVCALCHEQEAMGWATTHHAVAYRTLYSRDRATDLSCVGCHVTGEGEPGGFTVGDHSSALTDVTCESCHSAGGPHDGAPNVATETCQGCHDADHSIAFSLEKGVPLIDHYRANTMSETEVRARIRDLASGQAERPLLAFPSGPTVGVEVCRSCHKSQHKWWRRDPHASAMASLNDGASDQVACVRCHATPVALSDAGMPLGEGIAAYRTDEGVGCESCHGPGTAHAADPRADNIVALGESCPECVIEAVCTSCHVPKWDPGWELKPRLKAVSH